MNLSNKALIYDAEIRSCIIVRFLSEVLKESDSFKFTYLVKIKKKYIKGDIIWKIFEATRGFFQWQSEYSIQTRSSKRADWWLRKGLVVYEEEDKKHSVGSGECDSSDHVDCLRDSYRMRRLLFTDLDETWLKIILQMNDDGEPKIHTTFWH